MDVANPLGAQHGGRLLDTPGNPVGRLHLVVLDVDHADSQAERLFDVGQRGQLFGRPPLLLPTSPVR
jgi:hypothetical protein